jgi:hypothetical protein
MKCNRNYRDSYKYADPLSERDEYKPHPRPDRYHSDRDPHQEPHRKPYPHPQPKFETEAILRCGTSVGSAPIPCYAAGVRTTENDLNNSHSTVQATLSLDTSNLIAPTVKVDYSSLISFKTYGDDNYFLRLVFKLSKVCDGSHIPLGTWTFERSHSENAGVAQVDGDFVQETDPFCFSWCACDDCPDCCRYIVEIVEQQCYNIEFAVVSNISLSALAVGLKKVY